MGSLVSTLIGIASGALGCALLVEGDMRDSRVLKAVGAVWLATFFGVCILGVLGSFLPA
jgi:hypothetical protein